MTTTITIDYRRPCPYCGSTEIELLQFDEDGEYAAIFCRRKGCGASGPVVDAKDDDNNEYDEAATYLIALAAWNNRNLTSEVKMKKIELEISDGHQKALEIILSEYYPHADGRNLGPVFEAMIDEILEREKGLYGTVINGKWINGDKK